MANEIFDLIDAPCQTCGAGTWQSAMPESELDVIEQRLAAFSIGDTEHLDFLLHTALPELVAAVRRQNARLLEIALRP